VNKGLVMEKHRKYMIVLTAEGHFQKAVPTESAEIGEEVDFEPLTSRKKNWNVLSMGKIGIPAGLVAVAVLFLLIAAPAYFMPVKDTETYAYVSIDINPSIELQVDKDLHVKNLTPLNKDAETLKTHLGDVKGEDLDKVVDNIMIQSEERDLIANGKKMLVGVSYADGQDEKKASVLNHLRQFFSKDATEWKVATYDIPSKVRKLAQEENRSANELLAKRMLDPDSEAASAVSEKDKKMIHSFYEKKDKNSSKKMKEKSEQNKDKSKVNKNEADKTKQAQKDTSDQKYVQPKTQTEVPTNTVTNNTEQNKASIPKKDSSYEQKSSNSVSNKSSSSSSSNNSSNSSNSNNGNKQNYEEKKNENYNHQKDYDYKNNNPYRNKDYNQYKNNGEQYRHQNNNKDDDDDDDDDDD